MQQITLRACLAGFTRRIPYARESLKLHVRAAFYWRQTRQWLHYLNANPVFADLVASAPRLILKIYRPYLSDTMNCQQRMELLMAHYRFICGNGMAPLVAKAARAPVVLARLPGKSGGEYRIELQAIGICEREGEMILQLTEGGQLVYSTVFSFVEGADMTRVGVGCIQGPRGEDGLERIRVATRELHGLRPKNLLVRLVREIGHLYGCEEVLLVGNGNRTVRSATRQGRVHADYDTVWQEMGAQRRGDGNFSLAVGPLEAPLLEEVPSKKRAEVRRRHALMVQAAAEVGASMTERRSPPAVRPDFSGEASNDAIGVAVAVG